MPGFGDLAGSAAKPRWSEERLAQAGPCQQRRRLIPCGQPLARHPKPKSRRIACQYGSQSGGSQTGDRAQWEAGTAYALALARRGRVRVCCLRSSGHKSSHDRRPAVDAAATLAGPSGRSMGQVHGAGPLDRGSRAPPGPNCSKISMLLAAALCTSDFGPKR